MKFELSPRMCYISSSAAVDSSSIQSILASRGFITSAETNGVKSTAYWEQKVVDSIRASEFVVAVLSTGADNSNVYYEIGLAHGIGKRVLILASPEMKESTAGLKSSLYLRIDISNREAVEFALDQVLNAPEKSRNLIVAEGKNNLPIGDLADDLLSQLSTPESTGGAHPENAVVQALGKSGVNVLVKSKYWDTGADMAVWADEIESIVGNPLLIEVKQHISGATSVTRLSSQIESYLENSNASWLLLLYLEGPEQGSESWEQIPESVMYVSVKEFLESFKSMNFVEIVNSLKSRKYESEKVAY